MFPSLAITVTVFIDSLHRQMPVEEVVGSGARFSLFCVCGDNTYNNRNYDFPLPPWFWGKYQPLKDFPILYFSGGEKHTRRNASPFSGSIRSSCGTQKYLPYDPNGDFSNRYTIGILSHLCRKVLKVQHILRVIYTNTHLLPIASCCGRS